MVRKFLDEGIDESCPLQPQDTNVGKYLIQRLTDHISSLAVTASLRHAAVKPRHWSYLINVAGLYLFIFCTFLYLYFIILIYIYKMECVCVCI